MRRVLLWFGSFLLVALAVQTGLSAIARGVRASSPALASRLDPLATEPRLREALASVNRDAVTDKDLATSRKSLETARLFNPIDARIYGLLGEIELLGGEEREARRLFEQALAISPTELNSLRRTTMLDLQAMRVEDALQRLSVLHRRFSGQVSLFLDLLSDLMENEGGYEVVSRAMANGAPWRDRLLVHLASDPSTLPMAYRSLLDLRSAELSLPSATSRRLINLLYAKGQPELAYRAYLFLALADGTSVGHVRNSRFDEVPGSTPFDWSVRPLAGVETVLPGASDAAAPRDAGLRVIFRDRVVKGIIASQTLMLPPGRMQLIVESSARKLDLPKGLHWTLSCVGGPTTLAVLPAAPGSYEARVEQIEFDVPADGCPLQTLRLSTGVEAASMRYRYDGRLTVARVEIEAI